MKITFSPFGKWLISCFGFIAILIAARICYANNFSYLFIIWNLFLAWIPYLISFLFAGLENRKLVIQLMVFSIWLVFFPNALYIVSDIIHVAKSQAAPVWFDAILLFCASIAGLALGFTSLQHAEKYLQKIFRRPYITPAIVVILFAGSFGVYLGRFLRYNSWDILNNPLAIAASVSSRILSPIVYSKTWVVTIILATLYSLCWFLIKSFPVYTVVIKSKPAA